MSEHTSNPVPAQHTGTSFMAASAANSAYLSAEDLEGKQVTVTIQACGQVEVENDKGQILCHNVLTFAGKKKKWLTQKTNDIFLDAMFGSFENAVGKRITLHAELVDFGGKKVPGIRIVGSPDIPKDITLKYKFPRKKEVVKVLRKTCTGSASDPVPPPMTAEELEAAERAYQVELEQNRVANENGGLA